MEHASPLPAELTERFHQWKSTTYDEKQDFFQELAQGQSPSAMVISCCDSRVLASDMFDAKQGDFFMHRNIANLVPPYQPDGNQHAASAAIEYAVTALKVPHLLVIGHSGCGGIAGCYQMCSGQAPQLEQQDSFVGRWMDILRPGFERLSEGTDAERTSELEKIGVLVSLENLMTFPFVKSAVESGELTLHGLWKNIGEGQLECFDPNQGGFVAI